MKIFFERRSINYSISKDELVRVVPNKDLDIFIEATFLVRIIDGHPTIIVEPLSLFPQSNRGEISSWTSPKYIFILRRDGDAGRAILVDAFDRRIVYD